jgi:hypothetical protein
MTLEKTFDHACRAWAFTLRWPCLLVLLWPLMVCGCARRERVLYEVAPLRRDAGGKVVAGKMVGPLAATVSDAIGVEHEGMRVLVQLKAIGADEARFAITYPNGTKEQTTVSLRDSKDLFPDGEDVGVRIRVGEKLLPVNKTKSR